MFTNHGGVGRGGDCGGVGVGKRYSDGGNLIKRTMRLWQGGWWMWLVFHESGWKEHLFGRWHSNAMGLAPTCLMYGQDDAFARRIVRDGSVEPDLHWTERLAHLPYLIPGTKSSGVPWPFHLLELTTTVRMKGLALWETFEEVLVLL